MNESMPVHFSAESLRNECSGTSQRETGSSNEASESTKRMQQTARSSDISDIVPKPCELAIAITEDKKMPSKGRCLHCKKRRARCSGQPPACQSCRERGLTCSWDNGHGLTWQQDLVRSPPDQPQTDNLYTLVSAFRSRSDDEATMLLARLRLGASVGSLVKSIRTDSI